jgi:NAD(P)H-dependent flavin oxidoreductase YrpB (nitropropane dioxygenase family)
MHPLLHRLDSLGIRHPVMQAGMPGVAGPELAVVVRELAGGFRRLA